MVQILVYTKCKSALAMWCGGVKWSRPGIGFALLLAVPGEDRMCTAYRVVECVYFTGEPGELGIGECECIWPSGLEQNVANFKYTYEGII
jgi:hypothetical protein